MGLAQRQHQPDAPMPEFDETIDRALDGRLEIRVDPGVTAARKAAAEGDEGPALLDQIFDARVEVLRIGDDQAIDETALVQPPQRAEYLLFVPVQKIARSSRRSESLRRNPSITERKTVSTSTLSDPIGMTTPTRSVLPRRRLRPDRFGE